MQHGLPGMSTPITPADIALPPVPANKAKTDDATEPDIATLLAEPAPVAWYRRPAVWAGVTLILLLGVGIWYWQARRAASALPSYTTHVVARGNLTLTAVSYTHL